MQHLLASSAVMPEHTGTEALAFLLRWFHILAGVAWVGMLYFFNLVNVPFMKQVESGQKPKIFEHLTLPALNLFRWSSLLTVFVGFWYWAQILVGPDAHLMGVSPWPTVGLFVLVWTAASGVLYVVIAKAPSGYVVGAVTAVVVIAAALAFLHFTPVGRDDNHVLCIGVGGGLGWVMLFNVWGIIWRNNKKIIRGTLAGAPPTNAAVLARQAFLASRTNFFLSVPMLFFMAASSHYALLGN